MQYKNIYQAIIDEEESYAFSDTIGYKQILYITETRVIIQVMDKEHRQRSVDETKIDSDKICELLLNYNRKL